MNLIATNIKRIITEKGLKQCAIAARVGMSTSMFNALINGRKTIKAEHIPILADALGVEINTLFSGYRDIA